MLALFYHLKESYYGRFLLLLLSFIAVTPFVTHYYLTKRTGLDEFLFSTPFHTRATLQESSDSEYKLDELQKHINELEHVKLSLKNELRELESKRHELLRDIQDYSNSMQNIRSLASQLSHKVGKKQSELAELVFAKKEMNNCPQLPFMKPPKDILAKRSTSFRTYPKATRDERAHCKLSTCFDFQKCPLSQEFSAYVYKPFNDISEMYDIMKSMPFAEEIMEPSACVYVVIIEDPFIPKEFEKYLHSLKFWQGDGRNHVIVNLSLRESLEEVDTSRAIVVQTSFGSKLRYRREFDIIVPPLITMVASGTAWMNSAPQLPAYRKYLISFEGNYLGSLKESNDTFITAADLKQLSLEANDIFIRLSCDSDAQFSSHKDWQLCEKHNNRAEVLKASTFALIFQSEHIEDQTMSIIRFIEALQYGAIPVVLLDNIVLPFEDIINWHQAAIFLHGAQFPQLHFILRTLVVNDLLDTRKQGRFLWETYLSTRNTVLESTFAAIRTRLSLPNIPVKDLKLPSVFSEENPPVFVNLDDVNPLIEHRINSPTFYRNFSSNSIYSRQKWNSYPGALLSFPSEPLVPILPSSASFLNSSRGFQPLGKGAGGAGVEFQKALGGNYPVDQFTIVVLTYERENVLIEALGRLVGLQYLNKVIVVWNSPSEPSSHLKWPNIGVPLKVLRPEKNSLNNRFLPLDEIETDAVLSMDDDVHLRHDEILFGFRVWREARERLVGFPGRFHAWDLNHGGWLYNSNYSCELSMVLTGAAFYHKYYAYLYTYVMPQAIRDKVDEYINCEDIAMNFLISHVTRKPPIKVTSRWTFRCPGCPKTLSQDLTHFNERHKCMNFFVEVFGYMPLLRTQFRADSVLFKTRLPHTKTKCFAYI